MDMELLIRIGRHFRRLTDYEFEEMARMIDAGDEPAPDVLPRILDVIADAAQEAAEYVSRRPNGVAQLA